MRAIITRINNFILNTDFIPINFKLSKFIIFFYFSTLKVLCRILYYCNQKPEILCQILPTKFQHHKTSGKVYRRFILTSDNVYVLQGSVIIGDSEIGVTTDLDPDPVVATLNIEPGTVIVASQNSRLIIENGSKINATGNINEPIIFTTGKDYLDGLNQDIKYVHDLSNNNYNSSIHTWDGISIHGAAPVYIAPHFSDWPTNPSYWAEIWAPYVDETFLIVENGKHPFH